MRKPSASERRLLAVFGLLLFALSNLLVLRWYGGERNKLRSEIAGLEGSVLEYRNLLNERGHWEARQRWLAAHPLERHQGKDSDSFFVEEIQRSLSETSLSINAQQLKDSRLKGGLTATQLEFSIEGRLEQIIQWLVRVQQPGKHLVVETFILRKLESGDVMSAQICVAKVFRHGEVAKLP